MNSPASRPAGTWVEKHNPKEINTMTLTRASEVPAGDMRDGQLDIDELGREGAAVLITVLGWGEEKDWGNGMVKPVKARIVALTGSRAGEVDEDALIFKAGIRIKLQEVGQSVVGRLRPYGQRKHIGLEAEMDGDVELAERALAKLDAPKDAPKDVPSRTPITDSVKEAKANVKARAKAAAAPAPAFDANEDDDDLPPF